MPREDLAGPLEGSPDPREDLSKPREDFPGATENGDESREASAGVTLVEHPVYFVSTVLRDARERYPV